jgi:hypothetical protein
MFHNDDASLVVYVVALVSSFIFRRLCIYSLVFGLASLVLPTIRDVIAIHFLFIAITLFCSLSGAMPQLVVLYKFAATVDSSLPLVRRLMVWAMFPPLSSTLLVLFLFRSWLHFELHYFHLF